MNYVNCNKADLEKEYAALAAKYEEVKGKGLKLNMARGKPGEDQLNLSRPLLDVLNSSTDCITAHGADCRNYGELAGIDECKSFFAVISKKFTARFNSTKKQRNMGLFFSTYFS